MRKTNIQWCHSTVNPVMGCDGCELWPAAGPMLQNLKNVILNSPNPVSYTHLTLPTNREV